LPLLHANKGYAKVPQCHVTRKLLFLYNFVRIKNSYRKAEWPESTSFRKLQRKSTGEICIYHITTDFSLTYPTLAIFDWSRPDVLRV